MDVFNGSSGRRVGQRVGCNVWLGLLAYPLCKSALLAIKISLAHEHTGDFKEW